MRKTTDFVFFKNTPLIDFQNTIFFPSNQSRDDFFLRGNFYETIDLRNKSFNFVRDRSTLNISTNDIPYEDFQGVNYCTFLSDFEPNTRFYAYVISYEYQNNNTTTVYLVIDGIMTYMQGSRLTQLTNLSITRKHMSRDEYNDRVWELKNNDDIIKTKTKAYFQDDNCIYDRFYVLIQCTCDLEAEYGDVDNPLIETSQGVTFDRITSPVNLYAMSNEVFKQVTKYLSKYPWISQNISSVILIPMDFLPIGQGTTNIQLNNNDTNINGIYKFNDNGRTNFNHANNPINEMNRSMVNLLNLFNISNEERHLLRSEYTTIEVYSWDGQQLFIDTGQLDHDTGLEFVPMHVSGYQNEMAVYLKNYKKHPDINGSVGSYLNDALFFRNFDDVPILVDNYNLALSKNANQRQLAESRLVTNRMSSIVGSDTSLKDRFFNSASMLSNITPASLFGRFNDEHEFYRNQQAEFADLALQTPTITQQSNGNGLQIANNFYGFQVKYAKPSNSEMDAIRRYYKSFGFQVNDENSQFESVRTHTICDFVQFKGSWTIPNADVSLIEQMKAQFENGVRLWHSNNTPNPMGQNVLGNRFRPMSATREEVFV